MKLTDEQIDRARALWDGDRSLDEIASELGCSIYDLSPWLYRDHTRKAAARAASKGSDA